ncbi:MAG: hypothetical protein BMS9Abin34_451 [Patescibacteria group bacterium]|nr:MAG: hypothetical protein BMS9Abin34_451 [Patescibacteria group bacterium]
MSVTKHQTVSAVVPVFNEEKTVSKVIESLLKSPLIDEVIVINDGSEDKSLEELEKFSGKISIVDLKLNHGKGFALASGVKKATGDIVAFWDADFTNLSANHIEKVLAPVLEGEAQACVGYRHSTMHMPIFKNLSGQRAYRKRDLLPHLENLAKTRFGAEVYLNSVTKDKETKKIALRGLNHRTKYDKHNYQKAFTEYVKAGVEITKTLTAGEKITRRDMLLVNRLYKVGTFHELKTRVNEITSKPVKQIWEDYILRYLK